jgi:hypothetical protein
MSFGADHFGLGPTEVEAPPVSEGLLRQDNVLAGRPVTALIPSRVGYDIYVDGDASVITDRFAHETLTGALSYDEYEEVKGTFISFSIYPKASSGYECGVEILLDQPEWVKDFLFVEGGSQAGVGRNHTTPNRLRVEYLEPVKNEWKNLGGEVAWSLPSGSSSEFIARFRWWPASIAAIDRKIKGIRFWGETWSNWSTDGNTEIEGRWTASEFQAYRSDPLPADFTIQSVITLSPTELMVTFGARVFSSGQPADPRNFHPEYLVFNNGLTVISAQMLWNAQTPGEAPFVRRRVMVTTSTQIPYAAYRLTVNDILISENEEVLPVNTYNFLGFSSIEESALNLQTAVSFQNQAADLLFDKNIDFSASPEALDPSSYDIDNALNVLSVSKITDARLRLVTTPQVQGLTYTVTVMASLIAVDASALEINVATFLGFEEEVPPEELEWPVAENVLDVHPYTPPLTEGPTVESFRAVSHPSGQRVDLSWVVPYSDANQMLIIRREKNPIFNLEDESDLLYEGDVLRSFVDTGVIHPIRGLVGKTEDGVYVTDNEGFREGDQVRVEQLETETVGETVVRPHYELRTVIGRVGYDRLVFDTPLVESYGVLTTRVSRSSPLKPQTYYYYTVLLKHESRGESFNG